MSHSQRPDHQIGVGLPVFLALKNVGVRQYKNSDSKPGVGVSTQTRLPANAGRGRSQLLLGGGGGLEAFFSDKALDGF